MLAFVHGKFLLEKMLCLCDWDWLRKARSSFKQIEHALQDVCREHWRGLRDKRERHDLVSRIVARCASSTLLTLLGPCRL